MPRGQGAYYARDAHTLRSRQYRVSMDVRGAHAFYTGRNIYCAFKRLAPFDNHFHFIFCFSWLFDAFALEKYAKPVRFGFGAQPLTNVPSAGEAD